MREVVARCPDCGATSEPQQSEVAAFLAPLRHRPGCPSRFPWDQEGVSSKQETASSKQEEENGLPR